MTEMLFTPALLLERALFDLRRGLPVGVQAPQGNFLLWNTEFLPDSARADCVMTIRGESGTGHLICEERASSTEVPCFSQQEQTALLNIVKRAELLPQASVTHIGVLPDIQHGLLSWVSLTVLIDFKTPHYDIEKIVHTHLPTKYSEDVTLHAYRVIPNFYEAYAIVFGDPAGTHPVDIRLHAECFTGDFLGSLKCDCGPQLHKALSHFGTQQSGILIYLRQEGRNIGLLNKMRAYDLQEKGLDTVDANLFLGFEMDERDYQVSGFILQDLGVREVNLLTNNPSKIEALTRYGILVNGRIEHHTDSQKFNAHYLETKHHKSGHLL